MLGGRGAEVRICSRTFDVVADGRNVFVHERFAYYDS